MRVFNYFVICAALLTASVTQVNGREAPKSKSAKQVSSKAAGCSPAQTITEFFWNNVRTAAETGGNTWYDRGNGQPYYEVPAGGKNHAIFAGALWMGGRDPASNLKLAAIQFRQDGNDYWPGPLSIDGAASTTPASCSKWDKHFTVSRQMVEIHRYYFLLVNQGLDPTNDPLFADGYVIPREILDWPWQGDVSLGQSAIVAPFADLRDPETDEILTTPGLYEPEQGDYPLYDLDNEIDCRTRLVTDPVPLFGDVTMYWVFNDNGNIHSESQGQPIGMEIQAQMFGFNTNDEINNMTFVNYVLINRGTLTLNNTFFAQWVDTDLGNFADDYIGCDVVRGLGYSYNGQDFDAGSSSGPGYGAQPPAIGVDFFEGPYQDADGINNLVGIGPNQALNGLGYLDPTLDPTTADSVFIDDVIDNERFGMRRFLYHSNPGDGGPPPTSDPGIAIEYYNMMQGIWKDGTPMTVGGIGYNPLDPNAIPTDFMFPGTSDPLNWGTGGVQPAISNWTEETPFGPGSTPNPFGDRRFIQSAGPFTLSPGQFNNITVGVVYARASTGGPFASVLSLFNADDKAQALFENCFRLLSGPDAPELTAQELDKEIILYMRNTSSVSNNQFQMYEELDPTIPPTNIAGGENDQFYRFQGYQVYQLRNDVVDVSQIDNEEFARLVYQGDIKDGIGQIVNYEFDENIGLPVPRERVNGADQGIQHSIRITNDRFATGDNRLVNFKKYYYIAVAYGYNNYEDYNPLPEQLTGQPFPFLRGRSGPFGGQVEKITVIPHKPVPEQGGTVFQTSYGDGLPISRIEGAGNGGNELRLTQESIDAIMSGSPYKEDVITYEAGFGPLTVKIVDPLNVKPARFHLKFVKDRNEQGGYIGGVDDARWILVDLANPGDTIFSERAIDFRNEQILPEYGISVQIEQYQYPLNDPSDASSRPYPDLLSFNLTYSGQNEGWLGGVFDQEGNTLLNWIRSGTASAGPFGVEGDACNILPDGTFDDFLFEDEIGIDDKQIYEGMGIFAPARLAAGYNCGPSPMSGDARVQNQNASRPLTALNSVDLFFTPDKSKWSRSPVFEMHWDPSESENGAAKHFLRRALSLDKNGLTQLDPGSNYDEATNFGRQVWTQAIVDALPAGVASSMLADIQTRYPSQTTLVGLSFGMSWFPGYAITPETGERQNIAFGENSWRVDDNGNDMIWNPSSRVIDPTVQSPIDGIIGGGEHYVYVFRNEMLREGRNVPQAPEADYMPMYDAGNFIFDAMNAGVLIRRRVYRGLDWVLWPLLNPAMSFRPMSEGLVPGNVHISAKIGKPYIPYATTATALGEQSLPYTPIGNNLELSENNWFPFYEFNTEGIETFTNVTSVGQDALALIDVVPNPYYAYSAYETSRVDNRVKFINLPQECKIQIFAMNGTLVRILEKDNPNTFLEWDMQNERFIPIAGGMYLVHIQAPGLGERVLKFYAATRPTDLRNF